MVRLPLMMVVIAAALWSPASAQTVIADVGFEGSEAARYDELRDEYLISNLGPSGEGGSGFISRVGPDGSVMALRWIAGGMNGVTLERPLGIYVKGDTIYVADVKAVRMFARQSGAPRGSVEVSDAVRLNDLVVAEDGTVYVTDSGSSDSPGAIYRISATGDVSAFAPRGPALERPNGIAITADGNIIYGGRGVNLVVRTPDGTIVGEQTMPTGQFDGIVLMPDGDLLVASQLGKNVYRIPAAGGAPIVVAENIEGPAAIGLDHKRMRLLIPQIRAASLTIVDLGSQANE